MLNTVNLKTYSFQLVSFPLKQEDQSSESMQASEEESLSEALSFFLAICGSAFCFLSPAANDE